MWQKAGENLGAIRGGRMHGPVMWPIRGHYERGACGRRYPALGELARRAAAAASSLRIAALAAVIASGLANPLSAGDDQAAATLERYCATAGDTRWPIETVEIHAALPKLSETARLEAIRRLSPAGQASYQVLGVTGDSSVRKQVIVRYLRAEQQASEMPAASTAINSANYKFAFKSEAAYEDGEAYIYRITPRKKAEGLIKGELWLHTRTAAPVRKSGYLVKSPSAWIKRIYVTWESQFRDGESAMRYTRVLIEARLFGEAELVIVECPIDSELRALPLTTQRSMGQQ